MGKRKPQNGRKEGENAWQERTKREIGYRTEKMHKIQKWLREKQTAERKAGVHSCRPCTERYQGLPALVPHTMCPRK